MIVEDAESASSDNLEEWYHELQDLGPAQYENTNPANGNASRRPWPKPTSWLRLMSVARWAGSDGPVPARHQSHGQRVDARSAIRERPFQARRAGPRFGTCLPVLRKLETGLGPPVISGQHTTQIR